MRLNLKVTYKTVVCFLSGFGLQTRTKWEELSEPNDSAAYS